jgi:hypothetical protein
VLKKVGACGAVGSLIQFCRRTEHHDGRSSRRAGGFYGLPIFSVVYGLDWLASAAPTVRLLTNLAGTERIGIMVAWLMVIHQMGSASAAYAAGVLRIAFGSYLEAFVISGLLLVIAAIMSLFIGSGQKNLHSRPAVPALG